MIRSSYGYTFFDRHGKPLERGQRVTVQHCTGRYGQTQTLSGVLLSIGDYGDVYIKPDVDHVSGDCLYPKFQPDSTLGLKCLRGYNRHVDFEHGHETWIEIAEAEGRS